MKLKRILALLLACTMTACAFASCGDDDDDEKDSKTKKSDKADDDDDDEDDDDDDDEEEETTKKGGKKSSSDDDDEEDTTAQKADDDVDSVAESMYKAANSALLEMDMDDKDLPSDIVLVCSFDDPIYWNDDDKSDFSVKDFETTVGNYFDDLDNYEYLFLFSDECVLACAADSTSSKTVGFYSSLWDDIDEMNDDAADEGYSSANTLDEIYDLLLETAEDQKDEDTTSSATSGGSSSSSDSAESVAEAVYWAAYFSVKYDMDEEPDDALICSDSSKNIYDGVFDLSSFSSGFEDELKYEDGGAYIDNYEYVVVVLEQDIEFAAIAPSFSSSDVTIYTYDDDWKTAFDGMTLTEIIDYFN